MLNTVGILCSMIVVAAILALVGEGVQRLCRRPKEYTATYEHKLIFLPCMSSTPNADHAEHVRKAWAELEQLGGEGWQLVTIHETGHGFECWLKRVTGYAALPGKETIKI